MIRSMTGFGQAERTFAGFRVQIDVKSVNHRYGEVVVRLPREWTRHEERLKRTVLQKVKRGRIDMFVTVERDRQASQTVEVDWAMVDAYRSAAEQLRQRLSLRDELTLRDLLRIPDLISFRNHADATDEELEREFVACADEAVEELLAMREREGTFLQSDLEQRLSAMEGFRKAALQIAPQVAKEFEVRLRTRMQELIQRTQTSLDESRLAMEVAVFADRASIDEELIRLQSHFEQFSILLRSDEPVGRKMDFLVQEMNREVNTIGSKSNHGALTAAVVEMKSELEKMREQIQNIE